MEIILRAAAIYFFLWIATKALGKRELAQLSAFELILLVTMGDLIQQGVTGDDRSITGAVLAVSTMSMLIVISSLVSLKSRRLRNVLESFPVIVVRDGQPLDDVLRAERLDVDEVKGAARDQGIDDLRNVRVGILEPEGKFSFIVDGMPKRAQVSDQTQDTNVS
jgi:uncharacterized membrane protein YcaP (DUF421 family)